MAALLPEEPVAAPRDIIIQTRHGHLQRIAKSNAAYEPLHFPLMLPYGDTGWHLRILHVHNPTPNPAFVSAQQQQIEQMPLLQQQMQAEQQQQLLEGGHQRSAQQTDVQQMQQLRELQPS